MVPNTKNVFFLVTDSDKHFIGTKYEECYIFGNGIRTDKTNFDLALSHGRIYDVSTAKIKG